jgi:hypothetical protein
MMPEIARHATFAILVIVAAGCRLAAPGVGTPVSGRTETKVGVSFDFPAGWAEVPVGARPFTELYENRERQLELRLVEAPAGGLAITTHGDQMTRGLAPDGTVEEHGPTTVDGHAAYRVVVKKKTATGYGLVVGVTILRDGDRISTVYLSSTGDERAYHRPEIEALLATLKVK